MRAHIRRIAVRSCQTATIVSYAVLSLPAAAQRTPDGDQVEQLVDYAQCIRENGYPAFPDPTPDGGFKFRIERGLAKDFEAAAQACKDKMPSGMLQRQQAPSPEQMETLLAFAACVRAKGIAEFPDPAPQGGFDISQSKLDLSTPQAKSAMEACREEHSVSALMIRMGG
jgi:hypothetical protein